MDRSIASPASLPWKRWIPVGTAGIVLLGAAGGLIYLAGFARGDPVPAAARGGRAPAAAPAEGGAAAQPGAGQSLSISPGSIPNTNRTASPYAAGIAPGAAAPETRRAGGGAAALAAGDRAAAIAILGDLRAALEASDFDRLGYAEARLRSFVAGSEARALALVEILKGETDPAIVAVLAGVLAAEPTAAASPAVAAALTALAEDPGAPQPQREQALMFLAQTRAPLGDLDRRLAALVRVTDSTLRQGALAALSSRAHSLPPERARETLPLLLRAIQAEEDPELRAAFLAGIPLRDAPDAVVADVIAALRDDREPGVREAAAHALGDAPAEARADALAALERAFLADRDLMARRAILISIVRLAGPGALPIIERLRTHAGEAQPDCDDYIAILRSGETQAERIFELKFGRELARGGGPGGGAGPDAHEAERHDD